MTTKLIRNFLPEPITLYSAWRSEKLEMLKRLGSSSNVVVLGNSHIDAGFDPRTFDAESKKRGLNFKSLNLGIGGGSHGEAIQLARKFMRIKKDSLNSQKPLLLILEITNGVNFPPSGRYTAREINTYDYETTKLIFSLKNFSNPYTYNSFWQKTIAVNSFILNSINTGMLSSQIFLNKDFETQKLSFLLENDKRGFRESTHKINISEAASFLKNKKIHRKTDKFLYIENEKLIKTLLKEKNSKDFIFSFIAFPSLENKVDNECVKYPKAIFIRDLKVPIFNFTCLKKNPELFEINNWSDTGHLNYFGAQKLSTFLADEVTLWLKKGFN